MLPSRKEKVSKTDVCYKSDWFQSVFRTFLNEGVDEMMLITMAR